MEKRGGVVIGKIIRFGCLLFFYILATSKVITEWASTCNSVHSWWLHSAASLADQVTTMAWYLTQSHYPVSRLTSPCSIQQNSECPARKWQVSIWKSLVWLDRGANPRDSNSLISQSGRRILYSFGHPIWSKSNYERNIWEEQETIQTDDYTGTVQYQWLIKIKGAESGQADTNTTTIYYISNFSFLASEES